MSYLNQFIWQCHNNLIGGNTTEIDNVKNYLSKRNIKSESINFHTLGYCSYKDKIPDEIIFFGKDKKTISVDNKNGYSYFIKGRIIVPVHSEFGRVVGFATRKPSFEPDNTWWNLSKPFQKSNHLFLLDKSRKEIFNKDKIYLVEGYMDSIVLFQEGLTNVCGLMGTNLSPRQIGLISRYCSNICICLDQDKNQAGQKAQNKSIYSLKKFDFYDNISVINDLPVGIDPDIFVSQNNLQEFLKMEKKLTNSEIMKISKSIISYNGN